MFKLMLAVLTGTVIGWFVVFRLMSSTDHMPDTFSVETTQHLARAADTNDEAQQPADDAEAALTKDNFQPSKAPSPGIPASQRELATLAEQGPTRPGSAATEEGLRIDSKIIIDERADEDALEPLNNVTRLPSDDAAELTTENEENTALTVVSASNGSPSERGDSDADIKAAEAAQAKEDAKEDARAVMAANRINSIRENTTNTVRQKSKSVKALDIAYALPAQTDCVLPTESYPQVGVLYRPSSFAIKGQSLTNIDQLIKLHRKCSGGKFIVVHNKSIDESIEVDLDDKLIKLRQDEVKYYLLQRRIPKDDIILPDDS